MEQTGMFGVIGHLGLACTDAVECGLTLLDG